MNYALALAAAALAAGSPAAAQDTATPLPGSPQQQTTAPVTPPVSASPQTPPADAPALTDKEQATLDRCMKMPAAQQAQSSKCSKVMTKAGKGDPAKQIPTNAQNNPN